MTHNATQEKTVDSGQDNSPAIGDTPHKPLARPFQQHQPLSAGWQGLMRTGRVLALAGALLVSGLSGYGLSSAEALAAEKEVAHPTAQNWSWQGPFGKFDQQQLQRGFQIYKEVCSACHGLQYLSYRNLGDLGYSKAQIKTIASEYEITDSVDDEGEPVTRPARPADRFVAPFANDQAARAANGGSLPPDLTLMAEARANGSNYIHALLVGYQEAPEGTLLNPGQYYNPFFPGSAIAMAPPLAEGQVSYADGSPETVDQYARDVTAFLTWAAEPNLETRKKTGFQVMIVLFMFLILTILVKRRTWRNVPH